MSSDTKSDVPVKRAGSQGSAGSTFPIVGIGASPDEFEALKRFFRNLAPGSGAAFVVVMPLAIDQRAMLVGLLNGCAKLPVQQVEHGREVQPDIIFFNPPKNVLTVQKGSFCLQPASNAAGFHHPIDTFLSSLADDRHERAVGIVLPGTGSDGSLGLKKIKEAGGLVIVPDPGSGKEGAMLRSVIAARLADLVLPLEIMPSALLSRLGVPTPAAVPPQANAGGRASSIARPAPIVAPVPIADERAPAATDPGTLSLEEEIRVASEQLAKSDTNLQDSLEVLLVSNAELKSTNKLLQAKLDDLTRRNAQLQGKADDLQKSCDSAESFFGLTQVAAVQLDRRLVIKRFTTGALDIFHFIGNDIGRPLEHIVSKIDCRSLLDDCREVLRYSTPIEKEVGSSSGRNYFLRVLPTRDAEKNIDGLVLAFMDVTGLKTAYRQITEHHDHQEELIEEHTRNIRKQEALLEAYLGFCPGGFIQIYDQDLNLVSSFGRGFEPSGSETRIEPGMTPEDLYGPESVHKIKHLLRQALKGDAANDKFEIGGNLYSITVAPLDPSNPTVDLLLVTGRGLFESKLLEERVYESEERFRGIFENSSIGIGMLSPEGTWTKANAKACSILGYSEGELQEKTLRELSHPDDIQIEKSSFDLLLGGEVDTYALEKRVFRKNGEQIWILLTLSLIRTRLGSPQFFITQIEDITEHKESDEVLKSIEWVLANDRAEAPAEAPKNLYRSEEYGDLTQINQDGVILQAVGKEVLGNITGNYLGLLGTSSAIYEKSGNYAARICSSGWCQMMDQVSRKLCGAQDHLQAMNSGKWHCHESCWAAASKQAIADKTPVDIPCNGGIRIYAEPIFAGDEVIGAINFGYGDLPKDPAKLRQLSEFYGIDLPLLVSESRNYEHRPPYIIELAKQRLHSSARLIGTVVEGKRFEEELKRSREITIKANRAKCEFLVNLTHEIRTPINGVTGMLELLKLSDLDQDQTGYVETAINSSINLLGIINDVIDLSKVEVGKLEIKAQPFEIGEVMGSFPKLFSEQVQHKGLGFHTTIDPRVPKTVVGDQLRIRQVLFNLIGNAVKFTENGEIRIDVTVREAKPLSKSTLQFSVSDTGVGIPKLLLSDIFEPFVMADGTFTKRFRGSGFGMTVVKRLVELMSGTVRLESEEGKGTTVFFEIPLKTAEDKKILPNPARAAMSPPSLRGRFLLAEDDFASRTVLHAYMTNKGHEVTPVVNGRECLEKLKEQEFDLILMDIQMPVMNGLEATREIRTSSVFKKVSDIAIIAVTANDYDGAREEFLKAGMTDYVTKPVNLKELLEIVEKVLKKKRGL